MNFKKVKSSKIFFQVFTGWWLILSLSAKHSPAQANKTINSLSYVQIVSPIKSLPESRAKDFKIPIGLYVFLKKGWHSYWKNPGEVGKSLSVKWRLPKGAKIESLSWPDPERFFTGKMLNFGYKKSFLLHTKLYLPQEETISADVEWLICNKKVCVPLKQTVKLSFDQSSQIKTDSKWESIFKNLPAEDLTKKNLFWFLLLAFLGGLLLNFMPCVLPIVFLKFSITLDLAKKKSSEIILSNIFYSLGIISSFIFIAFFLKSLQKTGETLGWGFQMQSPYFLIGLTILFVLVSLNFMGIISLNVPQAKLQHFAKNKPALLKHFLTGVLSTTASSPCTAPFMASALGFAFMENSLSLFFVFFFLGLGLSFPYLLLSCFPHWLKYAPLPGPWSEKLKTFMAFPMLGTALWLITLLNRQDPESLAPLLLGLTGLALGCWLIKASAKFYFKIPAFLLIILSILFCFLSFPDKKIKAPGIVWQKFSITRLENLKKQKQSVFINITADWCLTCQWNNHIVFKNKKVIQFFNASSIQTLKGDWTHKNKEITKLLTSYERSGIPFYLYLRSDGEALVLSELLTPHKLIKTLKP